MEIRSASLEDLPLLYEVCLLTGDSGKDASRLYKNKDLLGEIYVGPYVALSPNLSFSLVDENDNAVGYVLGALDTLNFEQMRKINWLPKLQSKYQREYENPNLESHTLDKQLLVEIFEPSKPPIEILDNFPSHGHIDLHPKIQGKGYGLKMMNTLLSKLTELGSHGLYMPVSAFNTNALGFYNKLGFTQLLRRDDEIIIGLKF